MMRGILGRILLVAGVLGIAHQVGLVVAPSWFARPLSIPLGTYDLATRTAFYTSGSFNVSIQVQMKELVPGPDDMLEIGSGASRRQVPARVGSEIVLGDETFTVRAAEHWTGLMSDPEGEAMAQVSFQHGDEDWIEDIQLNERSEVRVGELDVRFEIDPKTPEAVAQARWGIEDNGSVLWYNEIIPGTGYETADGTVYTIAGFREADANNPAMLAVIVQPKEGDPTRIVVKAGEEHPVIKLDAPTSGGMRFVISPVDRFSVHGLLYQGTAEAQIIALETGVSTPLGDTPYRVRLEQYESSAVPVSADDSVLALVLESDARRIVVRQGVAAQVGGDFTLWYKLDPSLTEVTYLVSSSSLETPLTLESDDAPFTIATDLGIYRATPGAARNRDTLVCLYTPAPSLGVVIASIFMLISGGTFTLIAYRELSSDR